MLKDIANGVLITSLIFAASILIPVFGFFCSLFIPLPILYYRIKLGRTTSVIIPTLGFIIMVVVMGSFTIDVVFFAELLLVGFILGELLESRFPINKTVLYACGVVLISGIVSLFIFSSVSGKDLFSILSQYVAHNMELSLALYQSLGVSEENLKLIRGSLGKIQYILVRIIPALTIASTLLVIWINILVSKALLKGKFRFHPDYEKLICPHCVIELAEHYIHEEVKIPKPERINKQRVWAVLRLIILFASISISTIQTPKLISSLKGEKPIRNGTYETDSKADQCIKNLWIISRLLQESKLLEKDIVCPFSKKPYVLKKINEDIVVTCPNPELHGLKEIRVTKKNPCPEVME